VATRKITKTGAPSPSRSLVDKLDLFAIGLDSLSANLDRSNYASAFAEEKKRIKRSIESAYKVTDYSSEHFDVTATLSLRIDAAGFEDPILAVNIAISGHFHPKKPLSREDVEGFADAEARLIFWPYFRQIVSDTTGRMHIGTITLPLVVR
jgi:preprotein translocase subunit SecB